MKGKGITTKEMIKDMILRDKIQCHVQDENVVNVLTKMASRAEVGLNKYGVTTERTDLDLLEWLTHLQEELMDATIYIERIKKEY